MIRNHSFEFMLFYGLVHQLITCSSIMYFFTFDYPMYMVYLKGKCLTPGWGSTGPNEDKINILIFWSNNSYLENHSTD